jgi:colicin import membrane protein
MNKIGKLWQDWQRYVYSDWGFSILVHLAILLALLASVGIATDIDFEDTDGMMSEPVIINASFVDPKVTQAQYDAARAAEQRAQAQRQAEAQRKEEAKRKAQEQRRAAELAAQKKAREAKAAEARRAEQQRQKELERQAAAAVAAKEREAAEREAQRQEALAKAEAERQARAAQQAAEQAQQRAAAQAQAAAERQRVLTERQRYAALIKATIQRNLITNDAFRNKRCQLYIRLGIGGVVLNVKELGGDAALCRAAIAAVYKPSNLPVSRDPAVFAELREINLTVEQ